MLYILCKQKKKWSFRLRVAPTFYSKMNKKQCKADRERKRQKKLDNLIESFTNFLDSVDDSCVCLSDSSMSSDVSDSIYSNNSKYAKGHCLLKK